MNVEEITATVVCVCAHVWISQVALVVKNPPANAGDVRLEFDP